ncbi:MAG: hypothetical protein AAF530_09100 [Pseudomonadota bacterium]
MSKFKHLIMASLLLGLGACAADQGDSANRFYAPENCIDQPALNADSQAYWDLRQTCDHPRFLHHRHHRGR